MQIQSLSGSEPILLLPFVFNGFFNPPTPPGYRHVHRHLLGTPRTEYLNSCTEFNKFYFLGEKVGLRSVVLCCASRTSSSCGKFHYPLTTCTTRHEREAEEKQII